MYSIVVEVWEPIIVGWELVDVPESECADNPLESAKRWVPIRQMVSRKITFGGGFANLFFPEEPQRGGGGGYGGGTYNNDVPLYLRGPETGVESNGYEGSLTGNSFDESEYSVPLCDESVSCPWLAYALAEKAKGVHEFAGPAANPEILKYWKSFKLTSYNNIKSDDDPSYAWCAAFVYWCMDQAGVKGFKSGRATRWSDNIDKWGYKLDRPAMGAIAVFELNDGSGRGHITMVAGITTDGNVIYLGGNQSDQVQFNYGFGRSLKLVGYYFPFGYTPCSQMTYYIFANPNAIKGSSRTR